MTLSVLVPSYSRVPELQRCLGALVNQARFPDEVILVVRADDHRTLALATNWDDRLPLQIIRVESAGQAKALNAGLAAVQGDIVAITDDDVAPRPDWLHRLEQHFQSDPRIGGVGGRDWIHHGPIVIDDSARLVGTIQWFGRVVGNHHIGNGPPRDVDFLKGANMSYRKRAVCGIWFDEHLLGSGAQVSNDMAFSLAVRRNGWRLLYDPAVAVDHYPGPRSNLDQRGSLQPEAAETAAFNQYWTLLDSMAPGMRRTMACRWQQLVGSRSYPGLLHLALGMAQWNNLTVSRWRAASRGRTLAAQLHKNSASRRFRKL